MINARAETVHEKPAYLPPLGVEAVEASRCSARQH